MNRRKLGVAAGVTALSLAAAACGGEGGMVSGDGSGPIRVATVMSGQAGYISALIEEEGLDEEHDLQLEMLDLDLEEAANALRQGRAEVAMMSPHTMLRLQAEEDFNSTVVGPFNWSGNAWVVHENSPYESFSDLQGERIGNFPRTSGAYFFTSVLADAQGLDIEQDFQLVEADVAPLIALLEQEEVASANLYEPHVSRLVTPGGYRVVSDIDKEFTDELGARPLKTVYAAESDWVEENEDAVDGLQQTFAEAIGQTNSGNDRQFFDDNAEELFGITEDAVLDPAYERNREVFVSADDWSRDEIKVQNKILEEGIRLDLIPGPGAGWQDELWLDCYFEC